MSYRILIRALGLMVMLAFPSLTGCAHLRTVGNTAYDVVMLVPQSYDAFMLLPEDVQAEYNFRAQRYGMAVAGYSRLYRAHPWEWRKRHYLMQHGRSLYLMQGYIDAKIVYDRFMDRYGDSSRAEEVQAYLTKISAIRAADLSLDGEELALARGDVDRLIELIDTHPDKARLHYELGNAYWRLGEYDLAGQEYLIATELNAALRENELIRSRLYIDDEGKPAALDPDTREYFARQINPLVVFETHEYRMSRRRAYTPGSTSFLLVTGKVRNQSDRVLNNVRVTTNFRNLRGDVLDSQTYSVGTMGPGEVRAFVARSTDDDSNFNLLTYECRPTHW